MELGYIEIFVEDPAGAKYLYFDMLGFEIVTIQNDQFIWLKKGRQEFLIKPSQPHKSESRYEDARLGLVLYTDDVKETIRELEGKRVQIRGTVDSSKCYTFTDPDGNWFQHVNPNDH